MQIHWNSIFLLLNKFRQKFTIIELYVYIYSYCIFVAYFIK